MHEASDNALWEIACGAWMHTHNGASCPDEAIPTAAELGLWLRSGACPDEALIEAHDRLQRLIPGAAWKAPADDERLPGLPDRELPPLGAWTETVTIDPDDVDVGENGSVKVAWSLIPVENVHSRTKAAIAAWDADPDPDGDRPDHPAVPLVRAWQSRPRTGRAAVKDARILPFRVAMIDVNDPAATPAYRNLFSPAFHVRNGGDGRQLILPGFETDQRGPVLPLALYDLGAGEEAERRGPAAPLALRMWIESILWVHLSERDRPDRRPVVIRMTFREFLARLYPNPKRPPKPSEYYPRLRAARAALASDAAMIPWQDPDNPKIGGLRTIVSIPDIPASLDSPMEVIVYLPPGAKDGPAMPATLPVWGVKSAAAYRALIGLGFRWHRPGVTRIPVRGRKGTWIYHPDPARYEPLTDDELITLCFPTSASTARRNMLVKARETLRMLVDAGEARMVEGRIMPPSTGPKAGG